MTTDRIRSYIDQDDYAASLNICKADYVPDSDLMYTESAEELLGHIP